MLTHAAHAFHEIRFRRLQRQVEVIPHDDEGMPPPGVECAHLGELADKRLGGADRPENILPAHTPFSG